ncbi:MAG: hypothetical protein LC772_11500 [Chloroflexi bacterium]|nr:hypothetical protein [Chloroflexota bacterium]
MKLLQTIWAELFGLFVDDGSYAVAILVWVVAVAVVLPRVPSLAGWRSPLIFVGLAAILLENVSRTVRRGDA